MAVSKFTTPVNGAQSACAPSKPGTLPDDTAPALNTNNGAPGYGWKLRAAELSKLAHAKLVNRSEIWGYYLPLHKRTPGEPPGRTANSKDKRLIDPDRRLSPGELSRHFVGLKLKDLIGLHTTSVAGACMWLCLDIDAHTDEADPEANLRLALLACERLRELGFTPALEDSNGAGGYHVWVLFDGPRPSRDVYALGKWAVRDHGLSKEPEVYPKQADLDPTKYPNWVRVPGRHHTRAHWSRFYDFETREWLDERDAADLFLAFLKGGDAAPIPDEHEGVPLPRPEAEKARAARKPDPEQAAKVRQTKALSGARGPVARAKAWLTRRPGAVEGQGGGTATIATFVALLGQFGYGDDEEDRAFLLEAFADWNREKCDPPWELDDPDLERKLDVALESVPPSERGKLLAVDRPKIASKVGIHNGQPGVNGNGRHDNGESADDEEEGVPGLRAGGRVGRMADDEAADLGDGGTSRDEAYVTEGGKLCRWELAGKQKEPRLVELANFNARIVEDVLTSGTESRTLVVRGTRPLPGGGVQEATAKVPADKFESMAWVLPKFGAEWAIGEGRGKRDQTREAIQLLSARDGVRRVYQYNHTGWVTRDGKDYYLHAGGAIGADGPAEGFRTELAANLSEFALPSPPEGDELARCVRACLRQVKLGQTGGPNSLGLAAGLVALPWRAVLAPSDFTVFLVGPTGIFKTAIALTFLQYFAPGHVRRTPINWQSTQAHIEVHLHAAKDMMTLLDNFITDGPGAARELAKAANVMNAQGDLQARGRRNSDMSAMQEFEPRGSLLSTGEDTANRGSARGRALLVQMQAGSVDQALLTEFQRDAKAKLYAGAMAAYVKHLASDRAAHRAGLEGLKDEYAARYREWSDGRKDADQSAMQAHSRAAEILGNLAAGYRLFLEWAASIGVITVEEAGRLVTWHRKGLMALVAEQAELQEESDEGAKFLDLLRSLLSAGKCVLRGVAQAHPDEKYCPLAGWKKVKATMIGGTAGWTEISPVAEVVGWMDDGLVFLDPNLVMSAASRLAGHGTDALTSKGAVREKLAARELIDRDPANGNRLGWRLSADGVRRTGLWRLRAAALWPE